MFNLFSKNHAHKRADVEYFAKIIIRVSFLVIFALFTSFMFSSCQEAKGPDFILQGLWTGNGDYYIINAKSVHYIMEWGDWDGMVLIGSIEEKKMFSDNAGVLIIKITYSAPSYFGYIVDKYTGIYFKDGTSSSIKMGNAIGPAPTFTPIQADSLSTAESLFNVDNADTHISYWGSYSK